MNFIKNHNLQIVMLYHIVLGYGLYHYDSGAFTILGLFIYAVLFNWLVGSCISHIRFSHGKYKDSWLNYFFTLLILFRGTGSPLSLSMIHRVHHKYSDTEKDPHSPKYIGWFRTYFWLWKTDSVHPKYIKDYLSSPFQMFMHRHWIKLHLLLIAILFLIDPRIVLFGVSVAVVSTFHFSGLLNTLGHLHGEPRNAPELKYISSWFWKHQDHHTLY